MVPAPVPVPSPVTRSSSAKAASTSTSRLNLSATPCNSGTVTAVKSLIPAAVSCASTVENGTVKPTAELRVLSRRVRTAGAVRSTVTGPAGSTGTAGTEGVGATGGTGVAGDGDVVGSSERSTARVLLSKPKIPANWAALKWRPVKVERIRRETGKPSSVPEAWPALARTAPNDPTVPLRSKNPWTSS